MRYNIHGLAYCSAFLSEVDIFQEGKIVLLGNESMIEPQENVTNSEDDRELQF